MMIEECFWPQLSGFSSFSKGWTFHCLFSPEDDVSFDLELANDFASLGISIDITCSDQSWIKNDMAIDIIHSSVDIDNDVENGISQSSR